MSDLKVASAMFSAATLLAASITALAAFAIPTTAAFAWGGTEGCTPGYWKNHLEDWPAGYSPTTTVNQAFGTNLPAGIGDKTLEQALNSGGGGINALLRHAVSALLNSASYPDVDYKYTISQVKSKFKDAIDPNYQQITSIADDNDLEKIKNVFATENERGCPL